jgi:hypothetical protein
VEAAVSAYIGFTWNSFVSSRGILRLPDRVYQQFPIKLHPPQSTEFLVLLFSEIDKNETSFTSAGAHVEKMSVDNSDLPSNGVIVMNRQGKAIFHLGLDPPPAHRQEGDRIQEPLKSLIFEKPAATTGHTSIRLYMKHSLHDPADRLVDYDEVWDPERPEEEQEMQYPAELSDAPRDMDGHTQEVFLLVGMIADEADHSNDVYCEYGCPLQRGFYIIYLPAGVAWADLDALVMDLTTGIGKAEILDAVKEIDYVKGVMSEWSDLLQVEWMNETRERGGEFQGVSDLGGAETLRPRGLGALVGCF